MNKSRADRCVTHHHACDCREYELQERIRQLESERDALVEAAQRVLSRAYKLGRMDNIWVQDVLEPVLLKENDNG